MRGTAWVVDQIQRLLRAVDRYQRRHRPLAFIWAVQKKYGDDRGGNLAGLVAYYGFLSLFPLLLVFTTVASWILAHHPAEQKTLINSTLGQFPVVGQSLAGHQLHGSVLALIVGLLGLLWGAQGISNTLQFAMFEVWNVPGRSRPGFLPRLARSGILFAFLGLGLVATTFIASLGGLLNWGPAGTELSALPAALANLGLFLVAFKILSPDFAGWWDLLPGAALAGIGWTILQTVGVNLIGHQEKHAGEMYGTLGAVIGVLSFLYLAARITLYGAELNVVLHQHLWPRSLVPPPLSDADRRQLDSIAKREERRQEEKVVVELTPDSGPAAETKPGPQPAAEKQSAHPEVGAAS
jgi:YihY family inner membrane protein